MDLDAISRRVLRGSQIEDEVGKFDWKEFESIIGDVFRRNDFSVRNNFRFKTKRRYENDLIAVRGDLVFCVDCKRWSSGREKRWSLVKAAKEQQKRTAELGKFLRSNPIARNMMKIPGGGLIPMVVTLHQEDIIKEGETFVVPVKKLNSFVLGFELII